MARKERVDQMWAMFVRVKDPDGKLKSWRFEGFQEHEERVTEIEEVVIEENGDDSFFAVELPD